MQKFYTKFNTDQFTWFFLHRLADHPNFGHFGDKKPILNLACKKRVRAELFSAHLLFLIVLFLNLNLGTK